jgi:hypothetical protein
MFHKGGSVYTTKKVTEHENLWEIEAISIFGDYGATIGNSCSFIKTMYSRFEIIDNIMRHVFFLQLRIFEEVVNIRTIIFELSI